MTSSLTNIASPLKQKSLRLQLPTVMAEFKDNWSKQFSLCMDATTIDKPGKVYRFTIVYLLLSVVHNTRMTVVTKTNEVLPITSLSSTFASLNWAEREIWDMFGIMFISHPDLRRILTDYGFKSHPLRKDFPLTGFYEVNYNESLKSISYDKVELTQEFRTFRFANPWNTRNPSA